MKNLISDTRLRAKLGVTVAVLAAAAVVAPVGISSGIAAPNGSRSVSVTALAQPPSSSVSTFSIPAPATVPSAPIAPNSTDVQKGIPIGPIINWIKANAGHIWNGLVNAVKRGWSAFVGWWNGLASWIRAGINFFVSGSLWDLFLAFRQVLFGW